MWVKPITKITINDIIIFGLPFILQMVCLVTVNGFFITILLNNLSKVILLGLIVYEILDCIDKKISQKEMEHHRPQLFWTTIFTGTTTLTVVLLSFQFMVATCLIQFLTLIGFIFNILITGMSSFLLYAVGLDDLTSRTTRC